MEVSYRHLPRPVAKLTAGTVRTTLALAGTLLVSLYLALAQPVGSPWWIYADADAPYVASGLNLMGGDETRYLDHPGMPLQALIATTAETRYLTKKIFGGETTAGTYAKEQMLRLDEWRPYYRTYGVLFYLGGALVAYLACSRLLGHWGFGVAGGLLWTGAPGLAAMSIQFRADVPLAALCLLAAWLIAVGAAARDARAYVLAALTLGLAMTVKIHAVGLVPALAAAVVLRPPSAAWRVEVGAGIRERVARHRLPLAVLVGLWLLLAVVFNRGRFPPSVTDPQRSLLLWSAVLIVAYLVLLAARGRVRFLGRLTDPLYGVLLAALLLGIVLPGTLFVQDGLEMLVSMKDGLTGRGVNEGVRVFEFSGTTRFDEWPLREALVVVALAAAAAVVAMRRRVAWPAILLLGVAGLGLLAAARLGTVHYFAPAYAVAIPGALWLFRGRGRAAWLVLTAVVAFVVVPQLVHARDGADAARRATTIASSLDALGAQLLRDKHHVAIVDVGAPTPDGRYNGLVENFVKEPPPYPGRRFLEDYHRSLDRARDEGLFFHYYIGRRALEIRDEQDVAFSFATYRVRPLPELARPDLGFGVLELVAGPGLDRPYGRPDARYDPETGYHKDPSGAYFDLLGNPVSDPPKRKYVGGLWLDAYGDFWNAAGVKVKSDPSLRTAP